MVHILEFKNQRYYNLWMKFAVSINLRYLMHLFVLELSLKYRIKERN